LTPFFFFVFVDSWRKKMRSRTTSEEDEEGRVNKRKRTEMPSKNSKPVASFFFGGCGAEGATISVMVGKELLVFKDLPVEVRKISFPFSQTTKARMHEKTKPVG
jgi:hypothetical protein